MCWCWWTTSDWSCFSTTSIKKFWTCMYMNIYTYIYVCVCEHFIPHWIICNFSALFSTFQVGSRIQEVYFHPYFVNILFQYSIEVPVHIIAHIIRIHFIKWKGIFESLFNHDSKTFNYRSLAFFPLINLARVKLLSAEFMSRPRLDDEWKLGSTGKPFRPSLGLCSGVHSRSLTWDSNPGPLV